MYKGTIYVDTWMKNLENWDKLEISLREGKTVIIGNNIYCLCSGCKQVIKLNKRFSK